MLDKIKRQLAKRLVRSLGSDMVRSTRYRQLELKDKLAESHTGINRWAEFGLLASLLGPMIEADPAFRIVQIGASDGQSNDPIRRVLVDYRPLALLVEPQQFACDKLRELYASAANVEVVQAAITAEAGPQAMYRPTAEAGLSDMQRRQVASFSKAYVEGHIRRVNHWPVDRSVGAHLIEEEGVDGVPLDALLGQRGIEKVDLLVVDVEGCDLDILKAFPFASVQLRMAFFEDIHMESDEMLETWRFFDRLGFDIVPLRFNSLAVRRRAGSTSSDALDG